MMTRRPARTFSRTVQSMVRLFRTAFTKSWAILRQIASPSTRAVVHFRRGIIPFGVSVSCWQRLPHHILLPFQLAKRAW